MKELAKRIKVNGFEYIQLQRSENAALYEQWKGGRIVGYEVWKVRRYAKDHVRPDGTIDPAGTEYRSRSSDWGQYGWTFSPNTHVQCLEAAKARFDSLRE